jgi:hypothetical protein
MRIANLICYAYRNYNMDKNPLGVPDMVKLFTKTEHMYSEFLIAKGSQARQYSFMTKLKTEFQFSKT